MNTAAHKFSYFVLVVVLAALFRFYGLKSTPPGLYPDEATNGNNAIEALETGPTAGGFKVFYPENNGREGLFINIQALSVAKFGNEPWALRFISAIFGTLTVLGVFLLTRELFLNFDPVAQGPMFESPGYYSKLKSLFLAERVPVDSTALLAAFLVAVSFWHINFSRISFRVISAPFFLVFGFYFLLKAFNCLRTTRFALYATLAGLFFGLGFHTYIAYRIMPLLLFLILAAQWRVVGMENRRKLFALAVACLIVIFIVGLPLAFYFLKNPHEFLGRAADVSVAKHSLKESMRNLALTLGMFHIGGDWNWRHNYAGAPLLWWPVGIFFLVGIALSVRAFLRPRDEKDRLQTFFPLAWFGVMLLPNLLSPQGSPHALRALVALPSVFILAARGGVWVGGVLKELLQSLFSRYHRVLYIAIVAWFLVLHAAVTEKKYFIVWAHLPAVQRAFSANYVEEGRALRSISSATPKYVIVNFGWDDVIVRGRPAAAQTVIYFAGGWDEKRWIEKSLHFIRLEELQDLVIAPGSILMPLVADKEFENMVQGRWPHALPLRFKYFTGYRI